VRFCWFYGWQFSHDVPHTLAACSFVCLWEGTVLQACCSSSDRYRSRSDNNSLAPCALNIVCRRLVRNSSVGSWAANSGGMALVLAWCRLLGDSTSRISYPNDEAGPKGHFEEASRNETGQWIRSEIVRIVFALISIFLCVNAQADGSCGSFADAQRRSAINFAPVAGFVEVCSRDAALCEVLTRGYPSSVTTIAYFVTHQDWQIHLKDTRQGFSKYLIGQRGHSWSRDEFLDFKDRVRSNQGTVPDHTDLPAVVESLGRASLGVTAESDNSISFGVIMKLAPSQDTVGAPFYLASVNTALEINGETLSLYAFDRATNANDGAAARALMDQWLACIKARNPRGAL
jgi:hypothetical protein